MADALSSSQIQGLIDGILADGKVDKLDDQKLGQLNTLLQAAAKKNDGKVDAIEDSILDALDSRGMFGTNKEVVKANLSALKIHNSAANQLDFNGGIQLTTQDGVSGFFGGKQERTLRLDAFDLETPAAPQQPAAPAPASQQPPVAPQQPAAPAPASQQPPVAPQQPVAPAPASQQPPVAPQQPAAPAPAPQQPAAPPAATPVTDNVYENNKQVKADARKIYAEGINNKLAAAEQQFVSEVKNVQSAINAMPPEAVITELKSLVENSSEEGVDLPYILEMSKKIGVEPSMLVTENILPAAALENKYYKPSAQEVNALKAFYNDFPFEQTHVDAYKETMNEVISGAIQDNKLVPEKYNQLKDFVYNKNYLFEATGSASAEQQAQYQNLKTAMNAYESTQDFADTANRDSSFLTSNTKNTNTSLNYYDQRTQKTLTDMSNSIIDMVGSMETSPEADAVMSDLKQILVLDAEGNITRNAEGNPVIRQPVSEGHLNQLNAMWNSLEELGIKSGLDADRGDLTRAFFADLAATDPQALARIANNPTTQMLQLEPELANHAELFKQLEEPGNEALKAAVLSGDTAQVETLLKNHQSALSQSYMSWLSFLPGIDAAGADPGQILNLGAQSPSDIRQLTELLSGNSPEADTLRQLASESGRDIQRALESPDLDGLQQTLTAKEKFDSVFWGKNSALVQAKSSLTANIKKRTQIASDLEVVKQHLVKAAETAPEAQKAYLNAQLEAVTQAQKSVESGEALPEGDVLNKVLSIVDDDSANTEQALQGMAAMELFKQEQATKFNPELMQQMMSHLKPEDQAALRVIMTNQPLIEQIMSGTAKYGGNTAELQAMAGHFGALLEEASRLNAAGDSEGIQRLFATEIDTPDGKLSPATMASDMAFVMNQINEMGLEDSQSIERVGAASIELLRRSKAEASRDGSDPYAIFNDNRSGITELVNNSSVEAFMTSTSGLLSNASVTDKQAIVDILRANGIEPLASEGGDFSKTLARISTQNPEAFQKVLDEVNTRATGTESSEFWRTLDSQMMSLDAALITTQQRVEMAQTAGEISTDLSTFFTQNQAAFSQLGITSEDQIRPLIFSENPQPTARAALLQAFPALGNVANEQLLLGLLNLNNETNQMVSNTVTVHSINDGSATNSEISTFVLNQLVTDVERNGLDPSTPLQEEDKPRLEGIKNLRDSLISGGLDLSKPADRDRVKSELAHLGIPESRINLWMDRLDEEFSINLNRRNRAHNTLGREGGNGAFTSQIESGGRELMTDLAASGAALETGIDIITTPDGFLDRAPIETQAPEEIAAREALYESNPPAFFQQAANVSRQEQLDIVYNAAFEAIETGDRSRFEGLARSLQASDNRVAQRTEAARESLGMSGSSVINPTSSAVPSNRLMGAPASASEQKASQLVDEANRLASRLVLAPKGEDSEEFLNKLVSDFINIIRDQDYKTRQLVLAQLANQMMTDSITNFYKDKTDKNNQYHQDALERMSESFQRNIQRSIQDSLVNAAEGGDMQSVAAVSGQVGAAKTADAMGVAQLRASAEELLTQAQQMEPPLLSELQKERILDSFFDRNPDNDALGIMALAGLQSLN